MTTEARPSSHPLRSTSAYYLSFLILGSTYAILGPTLPALVEHLQTRLDKLSAIFMLNCLGYLLGLWRGGSLFDKLPGHRILAIMLLVLGLSSALIPSMSTLTLLTLALFVQGLAQGVVDVGSNTLLTWTHGSRSGPYMNGLHFCFGIGAVVAPIMVGLGIAASGDIHWSYWIIGLATLPIALWFWILPSLTPQAVVHVNDSSDNNLLVVGLISLFFFLYVGAEIGYGTWLSTYAISSKLETEANAAYLTSTYWGFFTASRLLGIWVSTWASIRRIIYADLGGSLISIAIVLAYPESRTALWVGTAALGICLASIFPSMMAFAGQTLRLSGKTASWILFGAGVGGLAVSWTIGQVFKTQGPIVMPLFILGSLAGALVVFFYILQNEGRDRGDIQK